MNIEIALKEYINKLERENFHSVNTQEVIQKLKEIVDNSKDV